MFTLIALSALGPAAVPPARDPAAVAAAVDREIDARLTEAGVPASPTCSDPEFLRRVTLDVLGRPPTPEKVRAFLADRSPDKRRKLLDELLASPEYGRYFADIWYDLLVRHSVTQRVGPQVFEVWLAGQFNNNRPWDATARDVIVAAGKLDASPPAVVWFSHGESGTGQVKNQPAEVFGVLAQKFLGQRLQCAECHNHPFTGFKQDAFWAAAALVSKVEFKDSDRDALRGNLRVKGQAKVKVPPAIPALLDTAGGTAKVTVEVPEKKRAVEAKLPDGSAVPADATNPRAALAGWVTKNPAFARAMANRVWAHFHGRGFVNPVDDIREDNPPSHPAALQALADEFAASGYDLKHLIRCVVLTKAYHRSSDALPGNAKDDELFSRAAVRPLPPGVLFHAVATALGRDGTRHPVGVVRANHDRSPQTAFARRFKGDDDEEPELAEYAHGVPQVLYLLNAGVLEPGRAEPTTPAERRAARKFDGEDAVKQALRAADPDKAVEVLYLHAFARLPTAAERQRVKAAAAKEKTPADGYALVLWALLNSSEFQFNH